VKTGLLSGEDPGLSDGSTIARSRITSSVADFCLLWHSSIDPKSLPLFKNSQNPIKYDRGKNYGDKERFQYRSAYENTSAGNSLRIFLHIP